MSSPAHPALTSRQIGVLLFSILVVALCGIVYELIIGTISSYLLGNSVYQFSLTIGFFMFSMGIGSIISKYFDNQFVRNFIYVEVAISIVGGISGVLLFMTFPYARAIYETVMYLLIFIIGALVGMEIPILTTVLANTKSMKESIANVMSLDYVGALIGAVAFPLVLLPSLGLIQSSFAIGILNIAVATVNVYIFRAFFKSYKVMMSVCLATFAVLVGSIIFGTTITGFAEKHLYFDQVIFTEQTPYQKLVVTRSTATREQRLYIDGHIQFSSRDEYRYHEFLVHPLMSSEGAHKNVLILGGGDGLVAREVLKYPGVELIHLVDIDPAMTEMGKNLPILNRLNHKSLHSDKITIFNQDAFSFINQPGMLYDAVIIDMPDPHNEALNKLYAREFYTMIQRRMSDDARLVTQSSSPFFTRRTFWCIEQTLADVFGFTQSYHTALPSFGIWGFNMASDRPIQIEKIDSHVGTRSITTQAFEAALVFTKDMDKIESPVNTIMEPSLYQLYLVDLSR